MGGGAEIVYTASTSLTLPDLSVLGLAYKPDEHTVWYVKGLGPAKTLDDYVATANLLKSTGIRFEAFAEDRTCTMAREQE